MACDSLLLPHLLMKKIDVDLDINVTSDTLLCPPNLLVKKKLDFEEEFFQEPCHLRFRANLSAISSPFYEKPILYYDFLFQDKTKVILPSSDETNCYSFPCPFDDDKLSIHDFYIESSHFMRSAIPLDILIEDSFLEYFESQMTRFIHRMIKEEGDKFHVNVYVTASIERKIWHEETVGTAKKIKEELRSDEEEDSTTTSSTISDCAVCFEEVEMSRFEGVELDCYHVFHVRCIAPWLVENNTCPMCRCVQVADVHIDNEYWFIGCN